MLFFDRRVRYEAHVLHTVLRFGFSQSIEHHSPQCSGMLPVSVEHEIGGNMSLARRRQEAWHPVFLAHHSHKERLELLSETATPPGLTIGRVGCVRVFAVNKSFVDAAENDGCSLHLLRDVVSDDRVEQGA